MDSIAHRPSLPIGFRVGDLPPIEKPLHSDGSVELYLLEHSSDSDLLLVWCPESTMDALRGWWQILGHNLIVELATGCPDGRACAIRIHGRHFCSNEISSMDDSQWRSLLLTSVQFLETALQHQLRPSLGVPLIWVFDIPPALIPICAIAEQTFSEAQVLHDFAASLLSCSTGIERDAFPATGGRLRSWNRSIPSDLFGVLIGCLPDQNSTTIISTFEEFRNQILGRPQASMTTSEGGENQGLSKIAGMNDLKEWLRKEVIGPLRNPEIYEKYRIGVPNGILFYGPPGCGKTYIARQLAEELGYFFQEIRPSDVGSPYIHGTVMRIRELFDVAFERVPSVVFIDEFDAFVPARTELSGFQQYKSEEVNEFLATLEGCAARKVLVIAATNAPEKIDPAVRRTGRFDKVVHIPPPDAAARLAMLQFHLVDRPIEADIDLIGVATVLDGYSASDIRLLVEEAARLALGEEALISTRFLLGALQRVPPSITKDDEERYERFRGRGI